MADLSARDIERAKFAFSIYDFEGNDTMDAFYLADCLRTLNLNPTIALCKKLGMEEQKKTKKMKLDEFLPVYSQVKKDKDCGSYEDFMEVLKLYDKDCGSYEDFMEVLKLYDKDCGSYEDFMEVLKLYDKEGNGTMLYAELEHILCSLGERMEKEEVIPVLAETCPEEDEDGFIPFEPFCKKLCEGVKF